MAKLIYSAITSLDAYVADEDGNFDWAAPDEEVHTFVNDLERSALTSTGVGYSISRRGMPEVPSWAELLRSWNESLPAVHEWRYRGRSNLRRDFLKAFDQIVNYYY